MSRSRAKSLDKEVSERFFAQKQNLQKDNVYPESKIVTLESLTNHPSRRGLENAIVCGGTIVNVVSNQYGHLPNEVFFKRIEEKLNEAEIQYDIRSVNRDNRSFVVDYILTDPSYHITVKNGQDGLKPMLRAINAYDGSSVSGGYFGFYREICSNGLTMAMTKLGFSTPHRGGIIEKIEPHINELVVKQFMDNEYYSLHKKFQVLAERPLKDMEGFMRYVLGETGLFKYETSEKNPEPSKNARIVMQTIENEAEELKVQPNMWLGYNAFNEYLHGKAKRSFDSQKNMDRQLFDTVYNAVHGRVN